MNNPTVALYIVAAVATIMMGSLLVYLGSLDRQVHQLKQRLAQLYLAEEQQDAQQYAIVSDKETL